MLRHIDSGQNSNLNLKHNGITRIFVGGTVSINAQGVLNQEGTEDNHLITKKYVDDLNADTQVLETAIRAAGFDLGSFRYRRGSDDFPNGAIQSNTTTNPENIYELKIRNENMDGIQFDNEFMKSLLLKKWQPYILETKAFSYVAGLME